MTTKKDLLEFLGGINDFRSLEEKLSLVSETKVKGDLFELFCQAYLLNIYPREFKFVQIFEKIKDTSILEKLNLKLNKDYGIDIIAITDTDEIWTIQAKFRTNNLLSWRELSTFMGSSEKAGFKLVMGNLNQILHPHKVLQSFASILRMDFDRLTEDDFKKIKVSLGGKEKIKPFTPFPHQKEAIKKAINHYKNNDKGQMIHACGTGKTLTALWIKENLKPKNTIVFVPSLSLLKQTLEEWYKHKTDKFSLKCVCSDRSVARGEDELDEPIVDIAELGVPVTTDHNEIIEFLNNDDKERVIFSTYQSSPVILEALKKMNKFNFDLGIFDEAHRTATRSNKLFGLCLNVSINKKLFMTATPKVFLPHLKRRAEEEDLVLCSMDDTEIYGNVFDEITFGKAIQLNLLSDYKIKVILVKDSDVKEFIDRRYWIDVLEKELTADELAKIWALIQSMEDVDHVISFHSRVNYAKNFKENVEKTIELLQSLGKEVNEIKSYHISGKFPAFMRSNILREFISHDKSLVTNARCLTEGVDVPAIDGIYFVDPKKNLIDIVQATGRAIRKKKDPNKKYGYIIIPIFVKDEEDMNKVVESSAFEQVWNFVEAMKDQDKRLEQIIEELKILEGKKKFGGLKARETSEKLRLNRDLMGIFDLSDSVLPKNIKIEDFMEKVLIRTVDIVGQNWDLMYGELKSFLETYNREPKLSSSNEDEQKLARWCSTQRQAFRKGFLGKHTDRLKKLEDLKDLGFNLSRIVQPWEEKEGDIPNRFWIETGALTGGSGNQLDLSMTGPNGSYGSVSFFGIDAEEKSKEKTITIKYKGKIYNGSTIKFPLNTTGKTNGTWRLQMKGVTDNNEKLTEICKTQFKHIIMVFEKIEDDFYNVKILDKEKLNDLKEKSSSWDRSPGGLGRHFGVLK